MIHHCDELVVGGGIAGLVTAWRLAQQGRNVVLLEASDRVGGVLQTVHKDGCLIELGAQTLQATEPVMQTLEELGLHAKVIPVSPQSSARYVLTPSGLAKLPNSPLGIAKIPMLGLKDTLRLLAEPLIDPPETDDPTSLHTFMARRFGETFAHTLLDAMVGGISGGDPRELDAEAMMPDLVRAERERGSVFLGLLARPKPPRSEGAPKPRIVALQGGMQSLVDALESALEDRLHLHEEALSLQFAPSTVTLTTPQDTWTCARLWLATSPATTAKLLQAADLEPPSAPIASVHLAWEREALHGTRPGFGWLTPSRVRSDVLGALWIDAILPGHAPGCHLRRVMIGGARDRAAVTLDDTALIDRARRVLRDVEGIEAEPFLTHVHKSLPGIPQYPVGHAQVREAWRARWPKVRLLGWGVSGIGVAQGIAAAREATEAP